jgi:tetratricopeptide (TPR) repeat protein
MGRKNFIFLLVLFILCLEVYGKSAGDSLFKELKSVIDKAKFYDAQRIKKIDSIKLSFQDRKNEGILSLYAYYLNLYEEYKLFRFDSAFFYAKRINTLYHSRNDSFLITQSKIKLFFVLLSAGMFKEASDISDEINLNGQPDSVKAEYYSLMGRYYYDLSAYVNDQFYSIEYIKNGNAYLDSALKLLPPNSFESYYYNGLRNMKTNHLEKGIYYFQALMTWPNLTHHQLAVVASTLGSIYIKKNEIDKGISYLIQAAIADITSSTKETYATFHLANILFKRGDFEKASTCIEKATEDASFYGARQRKVQVSEIMPIIQGSKITFIERQRKNWIIYSGIATISLLILTGLIFVIYRQFVKLRKAKKIISDAHTNLNEANIKLHGVNSELQNVNSKLNEVNSKLLEANKIKEEYIGYFFTINSAFFQKIDRWKKSIEQKLNDRKFEEIRLIINNINIHNEKEELLKSFDRAFLKLFPHFVEDFNALFSEEDQIKLQDEQLLTTDLRIYALIRLGIRENEKIAEILEYSIKSIYAYKTKIRNRSKVSKEEFDKKIMSIKSL